MNPDQLIQLLMQILGAQGQPMPGAPLGTQMTDTALSFLMPAGPGRELLAQSLGPEINKAMFGTGPFAGFGGMGSQWNYASRMTQYHQEQLVQRYKDDMNQMIQQQNQSQYLDMMRQRMGGGALSEQQKQDLTAGMGSDWRYWLIKGANAVTMPEQVGYGVRDLSTSLGYTFGAGFDATGAAANRNRQIEDRLLGRMEYDPRSGTYKTAERAGGMARPLAESLTEDFMKRGYLFGNLGGSEVRDVVGAMGRRGELGDLMGGTWDDNRSGEIKNKIEKTSRALSGIRDVLKGSIPEMLRQMESAFGGEAINTFGIEKVARGVQTYRQLAESTGTSLNDAMQYAQAASMLSRRVAGYSQGGMEAGLSIQAVMAGAGGDMRGVNMADFAGSVTERVTGARLSQTSMMVSGAISMLQNRGASEEAINRFRTAVMSGERVLNATSIAQLASEALGREITGSDVVGASQTRSARDIATTEATGQRAAQANSMVFQQNKRKNLIRGLLGIESDAEASRLADMSPRELEEEFRKRGREGDIGRMETQMDMIARNAGFNNTEEQVLYYKRMKDAPALEALARTKEKFATGMQFGGGGIAGLVKSFTAGGIGQADFGDVMSKFFGEMGKGGAIDAKKVDLLRTYFGGKDALGISTMMDFLKGDDAFSMHRQELVNKEIETLMAGVATGSISGDQLKQRIAELKSGGFKVLEEEYKSSIQGQITASAKKDFSMLSTEEKRTELQRYIQHKASSLAGGAKGEAKDFLNQLAEQGGWEKMSSEQRAKMLQNEEFKRLFFSYKEEDVIDPKTGKPTGEKRKKWDESGIQLFEKGIETTMLDYIKDIANSLKKLLPQGNEGTQDSKTKHK